MVPAGGTVGPLKPNSTASKIGASAALKKAATNVTNYCVARLARVSGRRTLDAFSELKRFLVKHNKFGTSYLRAIDPEAAAPLEDPSVAPLFTATMALQAQSCHSAQGFADVRSTVPCPGGLLLNTASCFDVVVAHLLPPLSVVHCWCLSLRAACMFTMTKTIAYIQICE